MTRAFAQAVAALVVGWLVGLLLIGVLFALPAAAQTAPSNCGPHDRVLAGLARSYGEAPVMIGLGSNAALIEVTASDASGTWTIIVTTPDGRTCLVASGTSFELIPPPIPGVPG